MQKKSIMLWIDGSNHLFQMIRIFFLCQLFLFGQSCFVILAKMIIYCVSRDSRSQYTMKNLLDGYSFPIFLQMTPNQVVWHDGKTIEETRKKNEETRWKRQCYLYFFSSNVIFVLLERRVSQLILTMSMIIKYPDRSTKTDHNINHTIIKYQLSSSWALKTDHLI